MKYFILILFFITATLHVQAEEAAVNHEIEVSKISDNLYKLTCSTRYAVNLVASVGNDGVLLIDAGFDETANDVKSTLEGLGGRDIKYIINTHLHRDHTGGNRLLGEKAVIIAHENVRRRLAGDHSPLDETPFEGLPESTLTDSMKLNFNGEEIRLIHIPGGHTDGDVIVYFPASNIVCLGDLLFSDKFPYVDLGNGGNVEIYAENIKKVMDMFSDDTRFIAGHGRDHYISDLKKYYEMLTGTIALVQEKIDDGKSLEKTQAARLFKDWNSWNWEVMNGDGWTSIIYKNLSRKGLPPLISICQTLEKTIAADGIDAAIKQYKDLKINHADEYDFDEDELNILGYRLLIRNRTDEAIEIFKLNLESYPNSANAYDSMAEAYMMAGNKELAIKYYRKSLELDPGNTNATEKLKELSND